MERILDTSFELSLRVLLLLKTSTLTEDRISGIDYITTYASDFGFDVNNLNGLGVYRLCEYPTRKLLCKQAIKDLVLKGLILPEIRPEGFFYSITTNGMAVIQNCECSYSQKYEIIADAVLRQYSSLSDNELISLIFQKTEDTLTEGENES